MRNPRRTAQTAAALMIGLALVSTIAVLGASLSTSAKDQVDSAVSADYIVTGNGGFSKSVAPDRLPAARGDDRRPTVYQGQFEFRGSLSTLAAVTPAGLDRDGHPPRDRRHAALPALAAGRAADRHRRRRPPTTSRSARWCRSSSPRPARATMRIGGIFKPNPLVGSFVVGDRFFLSHFDNPLPIGVLLSTAPGARESRPALNTRADCRTRTSASRREPSSSSHSRTTINQELGLVYVLLALAVLVALIGIVNTLMLSVFERTHEIGLLRAVGMKRRQVRAMIRSEAVIIALFGAVVGIVVGTGLGVALASSLRQQRRHQHRDPGIRA